VSWTAASISGGKQKALEYLGKYSTEKIGRTTVSGSYYPDEKKID
jgi:hypothetical protein